MTPDDQNATLTTLPAIMPTVVIPSKNASLMDPMICFMPNMVVTPGVFRTGHQRTYLYSFTLFLIQHLIVISATRGTHFLLRPLNLPRHISEIIGGFLLGPSVLGRIPKFASLLFPPKSLFTLESISYLGLILYIFSIGLGIELPSIRSSGWRCFWFAVVCTIPPLAVASASGTTLHKKLGEQSNQVAFVIFICVSFSVSAFSVLARTVADLKIINTEIGRLTLSSAVLVDNFAWIGLSAAVAISDSGKDTTSAMFTVLSGTGFYVICFALIRPLMQKLSKRSMSHGNGLLGEFEELVVLVGVLVSAFIGEFIGIHAVFGAFTYGLAIPQGPISASLVEKLDDVVRGIFLPLFFVNSGLRMNISSIRNFDTAFNMAVLVMLSGMLKVLGGVVISAVYDMQLQDGVAFGLLMNIKGVIELTMLNVGFNKKVTHIIMFAGTFAQIIGAQSFTILVIMSVLLTALVTPILKSVVKPTRQSVFYKRRTVHWHDQGSELRILACVHSPRDVPALISVIDSIYPTKHTPISVSAVQLIELKGHIPALLTLHEPISRKDKYGSRLQAQSVAVSNAFETYAQHAGGVSVRTSAAISPFLTMHEDIVAETENCHAALVLLPFHMQLAVDGSLEVASHPAVQDVNKKIMELSPCTVAVVVDRGIGGISALGTAVRVAVIFFGGPDDREALAIAGRMANHPAIEICVVRFMSSFINSTISSVSSESAEVRERQRDEYYICEIIQKSAAAAIDYREHVVGNCGETADVIRRVEAEGKDLLIVGKGQGLMGSKLIAGMTEWSEYAELGPIGDFLASADLGAKSSVLVVQAPIHGSGLTDNTIASRDDA